MSVSIRNFARPAGAAFLIEQLQSRLAGIPPLAIAIAFGLAAMTQAVFVTTQLTLPDYPSLAKAVLGAAMVEILCRLWPSSDLAKRLRQTFYAETFVIWTCIIGLYAAYASQRLGMPLQDSFFRAADRALGVDWVGFVRWVDARPEIARSFHLGYITMLTQILMPVVLLGLLGRIETLRIYVLALPVALAATILIAAMAPAASAITLVDLDSFKELRFLGRTPLDHLSLLRQSGPADLHAGGLSGVLSFPSFHITAAVLATLSLRSIEPLFCILLGVNVLLLLGTVTEGGHYVVDGLGGIVVALASYEYARRSVVGNATGEAYRRADRRSGAGVPPQALDHPDVTTAGRA